MKVYVVSTSSACDIELEIQGVFTDSKTAIRHGKDLLFMGDEFLEVTEVELDDINSITHFYSERMDDYSRKFNTKKAE